MGFGRDDPVPSSGTDEDPEPGAAPHAVGVCSSALAGACRTAPPPPGEDPMQTETPQEGTILLEEPLRGGQMWSRVLKRGQTLKLVDLEGGASVAALFYNAEQPLERYNMPDTLKAQHIARLTAGNALYSDMGRVLCSIVEDTCGWHDTVTGHGDAKAGLAKFGDGSYQKLRNDCYKQHARQLPDRAREVRHGQARHRRANVNFFVKVAVDAEGGLSFVEGHSKPGASIDAAG